MVVTNLPSAPAAPWICPSCGRGLRGDVPTCDHRGGAVAEPSPPPGWAPATTWGGTSGATVTVTGPPGPASPNLTLRGRDSAADSAAGRISAGMSGGGVG